MTSVADYDAKFLNDWLFRLNASQWSPPRTMQRRQRRRLAELIHHARANTPFYERRLMPLMRSNSAFDWEAWPELPLLTRRDIVEHKDALTSKALPQSQGPASPMLTSGTSGKPVELLNSREHAFRTLCLWHRAHAWHGIDTTAKLATIQPYTKDKAPYPDGEHYDYWTEVMLRMDVKGELATLNLTTPFDDQVRWLAREDPDYLMTFPSGLRGLAEANRRLGLWQPRLRRIITVGETLKDETRQECEDSLGAPVVDIYSTIECGPIAIQCPSGHHYHVQSDTVLVELLAPNGRPCEPGETGRVVVTTLFNYAFPLIRYQLDDYAVAGEPCKCGRRMPVIEKVLGRERDLFRFPDGTTVFPDFKTVNIRALLAPRQWQIAQTGPLAIEVRMVPGESGQAPDLDGFTAYVRSSLNQDVTVTLKILEKIPSKPGGKYLDYVCEL